MSTPEELYDQQMLSGDNIPTNIYMQKPPQPSQPSRQIQKPKFNNCQVLLKQSSKLNKKIIDFFKRNLVELNRSGYIFEWILVNEEEIDFYAEQDIDKFPSIVIDNDVIAGISNITSTLKNFIKPKHNVQVRQVNNLPPKVNTESDLKDFFMNEIKQDDNDEDEDETQQTNMHKKAADMMSQRHSMGLENPNSGTAANPEVHDQRNANKNNNTNDHNDHNTRNEVTSSGDLNTTNFIKKTGVKDDDDMMAAFWENQVESEY
jgi:hypothetical protein